MSDCHENDCVSRIFMQGGEPQAVVSEAKEGSPWFVETTTAGILRFAQNDRSEAFSRSL